jgi:chromate transporter
MGKSAKINKKTIIIPVVAAIMVAFLKVTAVAVIILAALGGIAYMKLVKKEG